MQKQIKHNTALRVAKTGQTMQGLYQKWIRHRKRFVRIVLFIITTGVLFLVYKVIECMAEIGECAEDYGVDGPAVIVVPLESDSFTPDPGYESYHGEPKPSRHGDPHPLIPYPFGIYD